MKVKPLPRDIVLNLSPKAMEALKRSSASLFNPSPEAAAWMEANRPSEEEIMRRLLEYYAAMFPDGAVH